VAAGLVVLKLHSLGDGSPRVVARLTDGPHEARLVERDDFLGTRWDVVLSRRSGGRYREALAGCVYAPDGGEVRLASLNRGRAVLTGLDGAEIDICSTPRR
jgi:hypothetical protein